jgi:hypothetical protein
VILAGARPDGHIRRRPTSGERSHDADAWGLEDRGETDSGRVVVDLQQ